MTHDEMIAVIQAHKEGKQIQSRRGDWWIDIFEPSWDFSKYDYRIKPEPPKPREWWIVFCPKDHDGPKVFDGGLGGVGASPCSDSGCRCVHVREVLPQ